MYEYYLLVNGSLCQNRSSHTIHLTFQWVSIDGRDYREDSLSGKNRLFSSEIDTEFTTPVENMVYWRGSEFGVDFYLVPGSTLIRSLTRHLSILQDKGFTISLLPQTTLLFSHSKLVYQFVSSPVWPLITYCDSRLLLSDLKMTTLLFSNLFRNLDDI